MRQPTAPRHARPFGVALLSVLWIGYGGLAILSLLDVPNIPLAAMARVVQSFGLADVVHGGLAVIAAITALGLWFMRSWGWVLGMLLAGVGLAFDVYVYYQGQPAFAYMVLGVAIVFYLNQGDVRGRFFTVTEPVSTVQLPDDDRSRE
jgi:hypothetical protein